MLKVGDIIKYKYPDCDGVDEIGIIVSCGLTSCHIHWFEEGFISEHTTSFLIKVS
jgi:predicted amidohydrolase